jgi:hypothetical protein
MSTKRLFLLLAPSLMASLLACSAPDPETELPDIQQAPPGGSEVTAKWQALDDGVFRAVAAASAGDEGAIAYSVHSGVSGTPTHIMLQRLDSKGAPRGSAIELGVADADYLPGLTLASDGERYIACWADDSQMACAAAPAGQGDASPGLSLPGVSPSLACSSGMCALAYGFPGQLAVMRIAGNGMADGSPAMFEAGEDPYFQTGPLLAATKLGFVLVGGDEVRVHTLDFALSPIAEPVGLGASPWAFGALAASDTAVAIHLSEPYGSNLFLVENGAVTHTLPFAGGGKVGLRAALIQEGTSFGMAAANPDEFGENGDDLLYRMIEQGGDAISERAQDAEFYVHAEGPLALLRLKDEMFVASIALSSELVVARIHRPD